ncbi:translation initiation factor IF-2-like isoform X2 [Moschus berezovskii]|nr:translation initiation factor IF-2-like isoform X2 [Moschus berezovskii]
MVVETLATAGVTTPGSGSAQVCSSAMWERARGTQSAPEAAMLTAASRGGPPRAAAQGPRSRLTSKEPRGHRAAWPRGSRNVPKLPALKTEVWHPYLSVRRRHRSSGLGRRPVPPDPLGPGSRSPRGQGSRNFRMPQQPCLPVVGLITLTPRCWRRCPRRAPWPRCAPIHAPARGMGQDAPSQAGNGPCNLLPK